MQTLRLLVGIEIAKNNNTYFHVLKINNIADKNLSFLYKYKLCSAHPWLNICLNKYRQFYFNKC